jgi:hypothetical protein
MVIQAMPQVIVPKDLNYSGMVKHHNSVKYRDGSGGVQSLLSNLGSIYIRDLLHIQLHSLLDTCLNLELATIPNYTPPNRLFLPIVL